MTVKVEGIRELLSNLSSKEEEIKKAARKGNLAGGRVVAEELQRNVPKSGYTGANAQARLSDNIVMSGNRTDSFSGESYVAIGFNRSASFRAHLPEFGSISQAPQGYMEKTAQAVEKEVADAIADEVRKVLG